MYNGKSEVPGVVQFRQKTEVVARCWKVGGMVNYCLVSAEFGKKKSFWRWMLVMTILQGKCT